MASDRGWVVHGDGAAFPGLLVFATPEAGEPAMTGTFRTDEAELHFDFHLEEWGEQPVRVVEAEGTPARRTRVYLRRVVSTGRDHVPRPTVDGRAVVSRCAPGAHRLFVTRDRASLHEREIVVGPGLNAEVPVRLPAR